MPNVYSKLIEMFPVLNTTSKFLFLKPFFHFFCSVQISCHFTSKCVLFYIFDSQNVCPFSTIGVSVHPMPTFPRSRIIYDNGKCLTSFEFEQFLKQNNIGNIFSAPYHPSMNGEAVRVVQAVIKTRLKKPVDMQTKLSRFYNTESYHNSSLEKTIWF